MKYIPTWWEWQGEQENICLKSEKYSTFHQEHQYIKFYIKVNQNSSQKKNKYKLDKSQSKNFTQLPRKHTRPWNFSKIMHPLRGGHVTSTTDTTVWIGNQVTSHQSTQKVRMTWYNIYDNSQWIMIMGQEYWWTSITCLAHAKAHASTCQPARFINYITIPRFINYINKLYKSMPIKGLTIIV